MTETALDRYCANCDSEDCRCGLYSASPDRGAAGSRDYHEDARASTQADAISEPAVATAPDAARVVPAPTNPMAVARELVADLYTEGAQSVLRHHRGDFYRFDGACWPEAEDRAVRGAVYRWLEPAVYLKETKLGSELVPWEPTRRKIDDVIDAMRAIAHLDASVEAPAWIDGEAEVPASEIVVVDNGLLHIPSRALLPHTPSFFSHNRLPFAFDHDAPYPSRWLRFLSELWVDDAASMAALQEITGYLIGGDTRQQKIFLVVGPRRGGKGTIGRVVTGLLGRHNVAAPTLAGLSTNFGLQELIDRPLGLISDARLSNKSDSSIVVERLLSISGEDSLTVDRKYRTPWTGRLPTRFLILTNELPRLTDSSGALPSRFVMLVLTTSFYGRENPRLTEELLEEAPGILNWALEGLDRLNQRGYFEMPQASKDALAQLEDLASPVAAFIRNRCELGADLSVPVDELWGAWKAYCEDDNRHPGTKVALGKDLRASAPSVRKVRPRDGDDRTHAYAGIALGATTSRGHHDHRDHDRAGHSGHGDPAMYYPRDKTS